MNLAIDPSLNQANILMGGNLDGSFVGVQPCICMSAMFRYIRLRY